MGKVLHKVFSTVVQEIMQDLTPLGESGSEVSHFITEPRNFSEVTKLSENIKKPFIKETLKEIKNLIKNQTFLIEYKNEGEPVTPCMDLYKARSCSYRSEERRNGDASGSDVYPICNVLKRKNWRCNYVHSV